jgi:outer membrane protein assembly factor BamB
MWVRQTRGSACTIYAAVQLVSLFRYALDSATGAVLWKVTVADNIGSSPSIGNNGMLYAAADSTLYAFAGK